MSDAENSPPAPMRKIRPWIAALLTFLGWGVGLFYARQTRAAIYAAIAQALVGMIILGALLSLAFFSGSTRFSVINPDGFTMRDVASLLLTAAAAICIWIFVGKQEGTVEKAGPRRLLGYIGFYLAPVIAAVLLALPIRFFVLHPFDSPAGSMKPTIHTGQVFVVSKWSYGYSHASVAPFGGMLPGGRVFAHEPERGDLVVFKNRKDGNRDYVKRLIGLPGDTVQLIGGRLHINGAPVEKELIDANAPDVCGDGFSAPVYRETLGNGVSYFVQECIGDEGHLDNTPPYSVPTGHYFMLGDNRDQSQDSRVLTQVGYIAFDDLVGKAHIASDQAGPATTNK